MTSLFCKIFCEGETSALCCMWLLLVYFTSTSFWTYSPLPFISGEGWNMKPSYLSGELKLLNTWISSVNDPMQKCMLTFWNCNINFRLFFRYLNWEVDQTTFHLMRLQLFVYLFGCNVSIESCLDSIVSIMTRLWAVWSGAWLWQAWELCLFYETSRLALESTRADIQWVVGANFLGLKQMGRESDHSTPSNAEVKNEWSYTSVPLCACVVYAWKTLHVMINAVRNFFTVLGSAVVK